MARVVVRLFEEPVERVSPTNATESFCSTLRVRMGGRSVTSATRKQSGKPPRRRLWGAGLAMRGAARAEGQTTKGPTRSPGHCPRGPQHGAAPRPQRCRQAKPALSDARFPIPPKPAADAPVKTMLSWSASLWVGAVGSELAPASWQHQEEPRDIPALQGGRPSACGGCALACGVGGRGRRQRGVFLRGRRGRSRRRFSRVTVARLVRWLFSQGPKGRSPVLQAPARGASAAPPPVENPRPYGNGESVGVLEKRKPSFYLISDFIGNGSSFF